MLFNQGQVVAIKKRTVESVINSINPDYVIHLAACVGGLYKNLNNKRSFTENDELGGDDLYSASKSAIEIIANAYNKSFFSYLF